MKNMAYEAIEFLKHKYPDLQATLANMDISKTMIEDGTGDLD